MSATREVMIARHPETLANREGRLLGRGHSPLTERGQMQRLWLGGRIAAWRPERVYVSPLERAKGVAWVADPSGALTTVMDCLSEIDFGAAEGLTWAELEQREVGLDTLSGGAVAPGGETTAGFEARVARCAERLRRETDRAAVVTHAGVMRVLLAEWLELPVAGMWHISLENAAVAVVRFDGGYATLRSLQVPPV